MIECKECGKTLGILKGYRHPTLGKKHYLCSLCFDKVNELVTRWREFVLSHSFNNKNANYNFNDSFLSFLNNKEMSFQREFTELFSKNASIFMGGKI